MSLWRVGWSRDIEIESAALIKAFPGEWANAQQRKLSEDAFAVECFKECDWETLVKLGDEGLDDYEWTKA